MRVIMVSKGGEGLVDPMIPSEIVTIFGWGTVPDQYGRLSLDDGQGE